MPDHTLLVPGTQATSLWDQHETVVYNAVRVSLGLHGDEMGGRPPEEWERLLSLEQRPDSWKPTRTSLEPGTEVTTKSVVGTPYERMLSFAEPWPYDWRMDVRYNAQLLLEHMRANKPRDGRFNLIGHSQGGLVIILASKLTFDINEFSRLVARVVLVGAPLAGALRAAEALLWGSEGLGSEHRVAARGMALTWPALYQMLPAWKAVVGPDAEPASDEQQLMHDGGWPGRFGQGIQSDLLLRAREAATLLSGPFARMGSGTMAMALLGKRQLTPVEVRREGDALPPEQEYARREQGDNLVPYRATLEWGGPPYGDRVVKLTGSPEAHAFLCNDPEVLDATRRFLRADAPPPPTAPPVRPPDSSFHGEVPSVPEVGPPAVEPPSVARPSVDPPSVDAGDVT
ncbi:MAG: hypothetical protein U5R14_01115 [Gemmatimonadota bacterium]|nr:hypothetical protein [Gemmatimonadota bacterium]